MRSGTALEPAGVRVQFIWFDPGELNQMPEDLPDPLPSADELDAA